MSFGTDGELGWEQAGTGGCCGYLHPPPRGFWGAGQLRVTPPLPGAFWTPNGFRINGAGDGSWAWRRQSLKSQQCAVAPQIWGSARETEAQAAAWPEPSLSWRWQRRCLLSLMLQSQEVREEKNSFALIFTKLLIELR